MSSNTPNVLLDSTVFWDDPNLKSGAWALLKEFARRSAGTISVPQVVIDEVEAKFGRRFDESIEQVRNASHTLGRLIDGEYKPPELNKSDEIGRYSTRLASRLKALGVKILPYPATSHSDLIKRQVNHLRPFQAKGTGYRDALIWDSLAEQLKKGPANCVLVTKNSEDFSASKETPEVLHPDLQRDLDDSHSKAKVTIAKDLDAFLDMYAKPSLKRMDDFKRKLESGEPIELKEELASRFNDIFDEINQHATRLLKLRRYDFRKLEEPVGISWMDEEPSELRIEDVLEFSDDALYLEFTAEYDAEIFGYLSHLDAHSLHEESPLSVSDSNWNDYYVQVGANVTLTISFRAVYDIKENKVVSLDIKEVSTDEDSY